MVRTKRTFNFASIRFRVTTVLLSALVLTTFPLAAMVWPRPAIVNATNPLPATYAKSNPTASAPAQSESPHTLAATYYSLEGNLRASINLNNKGIVPLEVKPTLFNLAGERLEVPAVAIEATTFQVFDLAEWAKAGGPSFQQGSLQLFYRGKDMLLGAQIKIVDSTSSLIFDEQLAEPTAMYSSRLEGLWWLPTHNSRIRIAISNTTDSIQAASLDIDGIEPKQQGAKELILQPHQTVLIDPAQDESDRPTAVGEAGGISINHSGKPGSLIARAMIQDELTGFSSAVQFADPGKARSSRLHGAGLRLGEIRGEELTPVVVARNISDRMAVVHGRIRYTRRDKGEGVTALREVRLRAGEVKAWDLEVTRLQGSGVESAGLEIDYSTEPGSVVVSALSVSRSGNHVFHVPMLDVAAQISSTGAYPFYMYGTSSTVLYIKNTTVVEQQYVAHLGYEGGAYRMGLKTIEPGETVTIDIRALRDSQTLDDEGQTIPPEVAHGQVRWTLIQSEESDPLALIGRAEQVDEVKAISSTYACQNCCGDFFEESYISPSPVQIQVGQSATVRAFERRADCYGYTYPVQQTAFWSSSNASVATVSGGPVSIAQVTSTGAGQTTITATWNSYCSVPTQCGGSGFNPGPIGGCCGTSPFFRSASTTALVFQLKIRVAGSSIHFEDSDSAASIIAGETFAIVAEAVGANGNVLPVNVGVSTSLSRTIGSTEIKLPSSFNLVAGSFTSGGLLFNRVNGANSGTSYRFTTAGGAFKDFFLFTYFHVLSTRVGLVGNTTSCGHVVQPNDHFVALPVVQLCNTQVVVRNPGTGQSEATRKRDKGPHFPGPLTACDPGGTMGGDFYWNTGARPIVESLSCETGNNNSGIDLADGTFAALGSPSQVVWRFGVF